MDVRDELDALEARRSRVYGPARLGRGAALAMWLLRAYVVGMSVLIAIGFVRQLR